MNSDEIFARRRNALILIGGVAAAAMIAALIVILNLSTARRDDALRGQQASYEAMILARSLDASIGEAEAMLGRFVISGKDQGDFGRLYFDDWRRASAQLERLDTLVTDAPTQTLIDRLRVVFGGRGRELADVALRTNYGQNQNALSLFYAAGRSPNVRHLGGLLDQVIARQRTLLAQRSLAADLTIARSNRVAGWLSLAGVLLLIGGGALAVSMLQAYRERQDEAERSETLEEAVRERTDALSTANDRLREEMSEREAAEDKLRQAQKLDALGQLTGGIAHDFNNMLSVVMSGVELAKRRFAEPAEAQRHLDSAMEGAGRAAALTRRLLGFARSEPLLPQVTDIGALAADMSQMLDRVIGDTIRVSIVAAPGLWPVMVDRHQLENALLNLAVNARDAMPAGGVLTVTTTNLPGTEGDHVRLSVGDTGTGMTAEVRRRIFEPFFTTKPVNRGTGLGLSQIFGFVQQSGGTIDVESEVGQGTTITILLPRVAGEPDVVAPAPSSFEPAATKATRTVLVIEDDPRVLAATLAALDELGHRGTGCGQATAVLDLLAADPAIDLVISDVMMPDMTGPELASAIAARHPDLPVLFVTGYADDEALALLGRAAVLRKPFTIAGLAGAIEAMPPRPQFAARAA